MPYNTIHASKCGVKRTQTTGFWGTWQLPRIRPLRENTLAFPEFSDIEKAVRKAEEIINSPAPSRVIMFLPLNMEHKFLVIADLSECSIFQNQGPPSDISLVLAVNKESLVLDPIDWSLTCSHLKNWSKNIRIDSLLMLFFAKGSE